MHRARKFSADIIRPKERCFSQHIERRAHVVDSRESRPASDGRLCKEQIADEA